MTPNQRKKKMPNSLCRFYAFRKLRFDKNGIVLSGGFSEPSDASDEDLKLWLPPLDHAPKDLDVKTAKIILSHVGDQFFDLVEQEREAQFLHMGEDKTILWKRVVQGVRELCDVCDTTLFNTHWVCRNCGFVVCIDCYKAKKNGTVKAEDTPRKDKDEFQWLLQDLLRRRHEWNSDCKKNSSKSLCKQLISAVNKSFSEKENSAVNDETGRAGKREKQAVNDNANMSSDAVGGSHSSDSVGTLLSALADLALHYPSKVDDKSDQQQGSEACDDEKGEDFSPLRELRPTGGSAKKSQVDEVVATAVEHLVGKKDEQQLVHFCQRFPSPQKGCEVLPVRGSLAETSLLYPNVPHSWLCDGKLLVLHDPRNKHNLTIFQEQWKRGQPVLVTGVSKNLNMSLWHPDCFCRDFEYTYRDGVFNLVGRLPECFVRPDLGPKMYSAYGSALYPNKGTTNLHLDVSDAVNVMVYVGIPRDGKYEEHINAALNAIDEGGCDALTRKRVREKNARPGALWHIYNARDTDKIRDLLIKASHVSMLTRLPLCV
ncbi:hypothetical protein MRX96_023708 [Rhipicephalus microplus]